MHYVKILEVIEMQQDQEKYLLKILGYDIVNFSFF